MFCIKKALRTEHNGQGGDEKNEADHVSNENDRDFSQRTEFDPPPHPTLQ